MDSTSPPRVRFYRFGPCTVDLLKGRLWRDGTLIPLTHRSLEVLVALIEDRGRLVQKDHLLERVWPNTVVEENNLARHVCMLRKALHERPDEHEYIVTVPGQGYRFVAEVEELTELTDGPSKGAGPSPPRERGANPSSASSPATLPEQVRSPGSLLERWSGRTILAVTLVAVSVISTLVALDRSTSRVESPPRPLWQLTYDPGLQHEPTWSPDGDRVAYTSDRAGNSDIWVQALADPTPIRVTSSTAHDWQPDWSPDGRWLAFRSERDGGGLYVISLRGGRERRVAAFGYRPRWSPDGSRILFSSSGLHLNVPPRMYVVGLDGQAPRPVRSDLLAEFRSVSVGWHPDGEHVSIWGRHRQTRWTFLTAPVAGGPASRWTLSREVERQLDAAATTLTRFVWSSSAQYLYFEGLSENVHNIWRVTVDPHTMAWIAGPERLTTGVGDDSGIALSPDGTKLAFSIQSANTRLWAFPFDAASGKVTAPGVPVTSGAMDVLNFDAPADSTRFVYRTIRAGQHELWERSIDDGRERLLIGDHEWARVGPTWSADGRRLAYQRERRSSEGRWVEQAVAVLPASGGAEYLLTTPGRLSMVPTDWSRDGSLILGACWTAEQRSGACVLPVARAPHAERHVRLVTSKPRWDLYEQRFSPDQRWISFNAVDATDASVSAIHVVPASGGRWTAITDGRSFDDVPRWAPDGRTVYFVSNRSGFLNVWGRRFDPEGGRPIGPPFQVTSFDGPREMLLPRMGNIKLVVSSNRLLVPVVETAGRIWILDNVDR